VSEIKITEEMLDAGMMVIAVFEEQFMKDHLGDIPYMGVARQFGVLEKIYRAMANVAIAHAAVEWWSDRTRRDHRFLRLHDLPYGPYLAEPSRTSQTHGRTAL
jgi:hypothetical protein